MIKYEIQKKKAKHMPGSLRLSLSEEDTMDEVEYIISTVPEIVEYLRNMSPVWEALTKGEIEHVI